MWRALNYQLEYLYYNLYPFGWQDYVVLGLVLLGLYTALKTVAGWIRR